MQTTQTIPAYKLSEEEEKKERELLWTARTGAVVGEEPASGVAVGARGREAR